MKWHSLYTLKCNSVTNTVDVDYVRASKLKLSHYASVGEAPEAYGGHRVCVCVSVCLSVCVWRQKLTFGSPASVLTQEEEKQLVEYATHMGQIGYRCTHEKVLGIVADNYCEQGWVFSM